MINVGVDAWDYAPVSEDAIAELITTILTKRADEFTEGRAVVTGQQRGRGRSDDLRQTSPGWMKGTLGMASQRPTIENPILNSPYDAPTRCFKFDADGITDEILDERRSQVSSSLRFRRRRRRAANSRRSTSWT